MTHEDPKVQNALDKLTELTPVNIHMFTDANFKHLTTFESVWNRHGPQAARFALLPYYWAGLYGDQPNKYMRAPLHFLDEMRQDDDATLEEQESDTEIRTEATLNELSTFS